MGALLKGIQSVLIALGIIAVIGTGVIVYYNTVTPADEETAAVETPSGTDTETEATAESTEDAIPETETEGEDITEPTNIPLSGNGTASSVFSAENGHEHTYTSTVLRPATCTEQGEARYECYCGDFYVDAIPALEHTKGEWITVRSATTTQTGLRQKSCTICGRTLEEETIPMLTPAADTNSSSNKKKDSGSDHRHTYTYEITSEASCTEKGEKTYTCTICGSTFKTSIPATNHPSRKTVRKEGSCANDGTIEVVCNLCDAVISSETLHYEHRWGSWTTTTQPTATAAGVRTRTCKDCGEQQTRSIAKLSGSSSGNNGSGNNGSGNNSSGNNGSGNNGSGSNGGTTTNPSTTHSHTYTSSVTKQATCEEAGVTTYTCTAGDNTYTEAKPEALGHKASGNWITTKPATTTEEGERVQYCSRCGKVALTEKIVKQPEVHTHTWDSNNGVIIRKATCTTTGTRKYTCTSCGYFKTNVIDALGHDYRENADKTQRICTRCGDTIDLPSDPTTPDPGPSTPDPGPSTPDPGPTTPDPGTGGGTTTR